MDSKKRKTPVGGARPVRKKQRWIVVFLTMILLVAALGIGRLAYQRQNMGSSTRAMTVATVCDRAVLEAAGKALAGGDDVSLAKVAVEIKGRSDHAIDPNCVYVLIMDAITQNNYIDGRVYLQQFERVWDADRGLDRALGSEISLDALRSQLARLARS